MLAGSDATGVEGGPAPGRWAKTLGPNSAIATPARTQMKPKMRNAQKPNPSRGRTLRHMATGDSGRSDIRANRW